MAENQTAVGTVAAADADSADSVTGYAVTGGADQAKFAIVADTGVLTFAAAPDFEDPQDAASTNAVQRGGEQRVRAGGDGDRRDRRAGEDGGADHRRSPSPTWTRTGR